jgi:hypothetical protein
VNGTLGVSKIREADRLAAVESRAHRRRSFMERQRRAAAKCRAETPQYVETITGAPLDTLLKAAAQVRARGVKMAERDAKRVDELRAADAADRERLALRFDNAPEPHEEQSVT